MLKVALVCDIQTRYLSRLWILLSLDELNLFVKEMPVFLRLMANNAF